jgi:DeoR/GlpR family transcriptional regulator of sugar metabolism
MAGTAVDRRHRILQRVAAEQTIHIAELALELDVSEMTIRRDIGRLERDGFLRRTYGGATAHITKSLELAFNARALINAPSKRLIGMRATELVQGVDTMFLGVGTTVEQFALFLPPAETVTIVTGSLAVASLLGSRAGHVVVLGGTVRQDELACIGPIASNSVRRYRAEVAVLGAGGISSRHGLTELDDEVAEVHRTIIEQAGRLIVLADGSKFESDASATVAPIDAIGVLVTDAKAPEVEVARIRRAGVEVIIAGQADARTRPAGRRRAESTRSGSATAQSPSRSDSHRKDSAR